MPIRIRKDKSTGNKRSNRRRSSNNQSSFKGNRSGGGIASMLMPLAISLFKKNPKLVLILVVVGALFYFLGGTKMCSTEDGNADNMNIASLFSRGLDMDEQVYDKAEVFEPLADNVKNPMPESISLLKYCPPRKNQGQQGSCVGWASGYAARTILFSKATGEKAKHVAFSPSFVYNQIALKDCQGTYLQRAMELMYTTGALPFSKFAYNEYDCGKQPTSSQKNQANKYRTKGFNRLSKSGDNYSVDLLALKQNLAQGAPVVIGMMVGGTFMSKMNGRDLWTPSNKDYDARGFGGHAMCVIGYDDYKTDQEGAFQIMNSWGEKWGNKGVFWIRYSDFEHFTKEAYGLYPMGDAEKFSSNILDAKIGLVKTKNGQTIPIKYTGSNTFKTKKPIAIDTDFKVEITNSMECYVYILGEESDQSSYVLFPYTKKHSPYCGITGTRVFPRDYSLFPDEKGSQDYVAIIVSKQKLDFTKLNTAVNNAKGRTYAEKVNNTLKDELVPNIKFSGNGYAEFSAETLNKNAVAVILEIRK